MFKVQANMDPNHRDRIAFVRLCSGKFRRGMRLFNVREKKPMNVAAPIFFFAQQRETIDEAFPGDIIGIPNHGTLHVGDTLTEGETLQFTGIPNFAPEILRRVVLEDAMRAKQLNKALNDLAEEGVVQIFRPRRRIVADPRRGRRAAARRAGLAARSRNTACRSGWKPRLTKPRAGSRATSRTCCSVPRCEPLGIADDHAGAPVFLARNAWVLKRETKTGPIFAS